MDAIEMRSRHQHLGVLLDTIGWGEEPPRERIRVAHDWQGAREIGSAVAVLHRRAHQRLMAHFENANDRRIEGALEVLGICPHLLGQLTYDPFTGTRAAGLTLTFEDRTQSPVRVVERARRGSSPIDKLQFLDEPDSQPPSESALRALALSPVVASLTAHSRRALQPALFTELDHAAEVRTCAAAGDVRGARVLRERFEDAARLLDDLGWGRDDSCTRFEITVPHPQLGRTLLRLHADASDMLSNAHGPDDAVQEALRVTTVTMRLLTGIVSQHLDTYDELSEWTR